MLALFKKNWFLVLFLILIIYLSFLFFHARENSCESYSLFISNESVTDSKSIIVFNETFSNYEKYSQVIDQVESIAGFDYSESNTHASLSDQNYGGEKSLSLLFISKEETFIIKKEFSEPLNLSRWKNHGVITAWSKIDPADNIAEVKLTLIDINGNKKEFSALKNILLGTEDKIKQDDPYPDYFFSESAGVLSKWEDFKLVSGWNYLFWRTETNYTNASKAFDDGAVIKYEVTYLLYNQSVTQSIYLDNIRVSDGLQKMKTLLVERGIHQMVLHNMVYLILTHQTMGILC